MNNERNVFKFLMSERKKKSREKSKILSYPFLIQILIQIQIQILILFLFLGRIKALKALPKAGVNVPALLHSSEDDMSITMAHVEGTTAKAEFDRDAAATERDTLLAQEIGKAIAAMHSAG